MYPTRISSSTKWRISRKRSTRSILPTEKTMNYAALKQRTNQGRNGKEILSIPPTAEAASFSRRSSSMSCDHNRVPERRQI